MRNTSRRFLPTSSQQHAKSTSTEKRKPDQSGAEPIAENTLKLFLICPAHFRLFYFQFICTRCCLLIFVANIARSRNQTMPTPGNGTNALANRHLESATEFTYYVNVCRRARKKEKKSNANNRKEMAANQLHNHTQRGEKNACERVTRVRERERVKIRNKNQFKLIQTSCTHFGMTMPCAPRELRAHYCLSDTRAGAKMRK